jgi:dTDP-glucose 4,6-dehydratase
MNILVTGGAGFIGSNLVHYLLGPAAEETGQAIGRVVNFDKLTYAGNPDNLAGLAGDPRHLFVQGDILRWRSPRRAAGRSTASTRSCTSPPSPMSTVRSTGRRHSSRRILSAPSDCSKPPAITGARADPARAFRFLHVSTDEVYGTLGPADPAFRETTPYAPNSPYSASKAGSDHLARAYHHTYGLPVVTTNCSNNYGPYQFPRKTDPADDPQGGRREPLPVYGDGSERARLALRRGPLPRAGRGAAWRAPRRDLQHRRPLEMKNLEVVNPHLAELRAAGVAKPPKTSSLLSPTAPATIGAMPSIAEKSNANWAGGRSKPLPAASARPSHGIWPTEAWVARIEAGAYRGERLGTRAVERRTH